MDKPFLYCIFYLSALVSGSVFADDLFVEAQRIAQQEIFNRFSSLDNRLNHAQGVAPLVKSPSESNVSRVDHTAFPQGTRDPFAIPSLLLQALSNSHHQKVHNNQLADYSFSKSSAELMPVIKLKGIIHHTLNKAPLAIVLLNGETFMVRENDKVGFDPTKPSQVIKIKKINRLSVLVEVGTLGEMVIVR